ncbi:MAG: PorV/PorQ family protein [Rhodothermales bacterium]|nr:PorV/PorQ family protein [Rhodothermales bacterium]MBO6781305.1 PorV/PorQ family protein [Rhodothermales bacterium]
MTVRLRLTFLAVLIFAAHPALGQRVAKYGADFLAGGVGARSLGMGGAHVALADDVNAVYWNAAGLMGLEFPQVAYMHAERFSGSVSFDYAAGAMPLTDRSTVALAIFRSGVNDIKNTLDAWDPARDQPRPDPGDFITTFSAADYAVFVGYGRTLRDRLDIGLTAKLIRRSIGDFASAWGYSFDASAKWTGPSWQFGVNLQDLTTMLQSWSVNSDNLQQLETVFGDEMPEGGSELVLPVARFGVAHTAPAASGTLTFAADLDLAFDGQDANAIDVAGVSLHPRLGAEYAYEGVAFLRAGLARIRQVQGEGLDMSPTVGAGFAFRGIAVDYGFGDFAGLTSALGFSHRVSLSYRFSKEAYRRPSAD